MHKEQIKGLIRRYEAVLFTVNRRMHSFIKEQIPDELTIEQFQTIRYIRGQGRCTSSELADIFCVGKSSITAITTRLFDKSLIARMPDDKDRRVTYLSLTEQGERLSNEIEDKIEQLLSSLIGNFDAAEAFQFIETFEKLARLMEEPQERGNSNL